MPDDRVLNWLVSRERYHFSSSLLLTVSDYEYLLQHLDYLGIPNGFAALCVCSDTLSFEHQDPEQFIPDVQERQTYH